MIWIAFAVHMFVSVVVGWAVFLLGKRFLPEPWNQASVVIPLAAALGLLLIIATLPHWHLAQG
ncbi:hypothetical protein JI749_15900 [Devosia oryziradicis]|uniref:Uncharacterized protein n=1 Tax=Devosia oryziradicis TaxID=2801335 RepID=A0ABX7BV64_9HYPH|nr:hypothetical protein [Devosia oryziradicis]QQR35808.1 hypothetical protein JI749_15900 [Devosia oryziradicis]